jgi:multidrug efflux system membrane fusion protein
MSAERHRAVTTPALDVSTTRRAISKPALALIACGVAAAGVAYVALAPQPQSTPQAPPPIPVVTAVVHQQNVPIILTGLGTVQALNAATIRSQVTGLLERVDFDEGQFVKQGDVLAQIDPRIYQARLDQAQAQLARDQAELINVQTNLGRNLPLLQRGFATDQQVTDERAQVTQLQNTLKGDQAAIDAAKVELDYTTLRAPFSGVAGIRLIDIGNVIHPTDPNGVVVLTQVQPINVLFTSPQKTFQRFRQHSPTGLSRLSFMIRGGQTPRHRQASAHQQPGRPDLRNRSIEGVVSK